MLSRTESIGRVGDLGEALLEVGEERGLVVGEDGEGGVVAHRAGGLGAVAGGGADQDAQVLLAQPKASWRAASGSWARRGRPR